MILSPSAAQQIVHALSSVSSKSSRSEFAQNSVEIINQKILVELVSLWMFSKDKKIATFQAGTGDIGRYLMTKSHKISLSKSPTMLALVAEGKICVTDDWSGKIYRGRVPEIVKLGTLLPIQLWKEYEVPALEKEGIKSSAQLPAPRWEIAMPLRIGKIFFGALDVQILEFSRFTLDDCSSLQWLADQLSSIYMKQN